MARRSRRKFKLSIKAINELENDEATGHKAEELHRHSQAELSHRGKVIIQQVIIRPAAKKSSSLRQQENKQKEHQSNEETKKLSKFSVKP
jgi:hypothetical protein